jgi:ribosomal protein L16 Arg81 hydroxylase
MASYAQNLVASASALENILSPMSSNEFIDNHFGKSFLHVRGTKGKFSDLVPWSKLNQILEEHRLQPPRLRLYQAGKPVAPEKYLTQDGRGLLLQAAEVTNLLAQGATLIVDAFDELHRPVRELAVSLERVFRINVQVNLYAGWRTDQGFDLHYDKHDTLILQVAGRKHWKVYRPTRLYPLEKEKDVERAKEPTEEPIWDNILNDGEMLYIPRGWWHVVYPVDEPTLHLTIGLRNYRGIDLLHWFVEEFKNYDEVRQDIPHLADRDTQVAYMSKLREQLFRTWSDDLMDRFLSTADARASSRPHLELPGAATTEGIAISRKSRVRLTSPRRVEIYSKSENGSRMLRSPGKTSYCSEAILPVMEKLHDGQIHAVHELIALVPDQAGNILNFLQGLILRGILAAVVDTAANSA